MRQLMLLAAVAGLAVARPETYREKEDFQFSRSSTDEGSKSGFYGAQRGNMGGNYERAHNMDPLAQHQMSGLVKTVEGELGDGAKQTSGSVYSSANSKGVYGSRNYDLSNLEGRNFQDSASLGSQSSLSYHHGTGYQGQLSTSNNAGHGSSQSYNSGYRQNHDSRYGYNSAGNSEQSLYSSNHHHDSDNLQSASQYEDRDLAQNSGYYSQAAGYQGHAYDQGRSLAQTSDGYGSTIHTRLVNGNPVKIIIRPGTRVFVPIAAQTSQSAASFDQNAINTETEVLNGNDQQVVLKPEAKHYESSYSYRKEWEKHDTKPVHSAVPLAIPTVNPYPANSELYEDTQGQTLEQRQSASNIALQNQHSSHSGYNSAASSHSSDYNSRHHSSGSNTASSAYNGAYNGDSTGAYNRRIASGAYIGTANSGASGLNQVEDSSNPKSYQSQYSYHKSWERQGDPYIIIPSTNGVPSEQASGKLTAASLNQGAYGNSHQHGSHHHSHQGYSSNVDCDENGHIRVARSTDTHNHQALTRGDIIDQDDLGQQTQQQWSKIEDLGQQTQSKWDNFEELGQQTQNTWGKLGQQTESKWDNFEELGQQTQNTWGKLDQQTEPKWDKLQDEGQQTQILWGQQETQNKWDTENLGQQTQNQWDQRDVGQQTQNTWGKLKLEPERQTDLGQQTQDTWTMLEIKPSGNDTRLIEQKPSEPGNAHDNAFEIAHSSKHQNYNTDAHTLETDTNNSSSHHVHTIWDEIKKEEIGQESEDTVESDLTQTADIGQQTQGLWGNINHNENSYKPWHQEAEDQVQTSLTNSVQNNKFSHNTPNPHPWMYNQMHDHQKNRSNSNQYFAHSSSFSTVSGSRSHNYWEKEHSTNINSNSSDNSNVPINPSGSMYGLMSLWNKLETIEKQTIPSQGNDKDSQYVEQHGTSNFFDTQAQHDVFDSHTDIKPLQHSIKPQIINKNYKVQNHGIGRGDIGEEDSSNEQSKPADSKSYKTLEEIETLSLTKEANKHDDMQDNNMTKEGQTELLSVMSLDQQNHSANQDKEKQLSGHNGASLTAVINSTQINDYHHMHHSEETHHTNAEEESHIIEHQFENQGEKNLDQQTLINQFSQENQQKKTDQHFVDFEQQSENNQPEQMEQQFEIQNIGQSESFHQGKQAENLSQENEQFDQVSLSGWKPDKNVQQEHKLENWGEANENLEQQSQSGWAEHMEDQQFQTASKPIENFKQSMMTDTFEQPMENLSQHVQPAWKPTEDLQQQSHITDTFGQPMEDLSQQVQPAWKSTEDLQQQSQMTDTFEQPMEDLSQQVQTARMSDLQQHSQMTDTFEQPMEDLSQQVQTAWKPTEDSQHNQQIDVFSTQLDQNKEIPPTFYKQPVVVEEIIISKKVADNNFPPETDAVTEKPGFWKSVGSKFTSAKDKVSSWFSS